MTETAQETATKTSLQSAPQTEQPGATSLIQVIERVAMNPEADIDKMERLMAMHERMMEKQAEQAYTSAMTEAQSKAPIIEQDAINTQTSSRYSTLLATNKRIVPVYTNEGFSLSFGEEDSPKENHIRIICDVMHRGGYTKRYHRDMPIDDKGIKGTVNKTLIHAGGSTVSYGRRYLTNMIFNLSTGDDDDGNAATVIETIAQPQAETLLSLITEVDADIPKFLVFCGVAKIEDLPVDQYQNALNALEMKRKKA